MIKKCKITDNLSSPVLAILFLLSKFFFDFSKFWENLEKKCQIFYDFSQSW